MKKILNSVVILVALLAACTDYVQEIDNQYDEWNRSGLGNAENNSAVVDPSTVVIGKVTDSRDNQTYKTVTIGAQTWMAENLNYETENSFCYGSADSNCTKYGRLYTWAAAMDSVGTWSTNGKGCGYDKTCSPTYPVRGICPEGWHLPDSTEWNTLFTAVGGKSTAGKMLKSTSGWNSNGNGMDAFAFSALPAGYRRPNGDFNDEGTNAFFWSSSEGDSNYSSIVDLYYGDGNAYLNNDSKLYGFSVRCLKDGGSTVTSSFSITPQSNSSETSVSSSSIKSSSSTIVSSSSEKAESSSSKANEPAEGVLIDSRDGQTYKTVTIGTQIWMAENLNYAYTGVPYNYSGYTSDSTSWCYSDAAANCTKYGRLYTWSAAMDSVGTWFANGKGCGYNKTCSPTYPVRGVCPEGWHLPTQTEWNTLFTAVGGQSTAGKMLKSTSGWASSGNGTDAYSFSALPAGYGFSTGDYDNEGNGAYFWSSTEHGSYYAGNMYLFYDDDAYLGSSYKHYGFSVRCVKDD